MVLAGTGRHCVVSAGAELDHNKKLGDQDTMNISTHKQKKTISLSMNPVNARYMIQHATNSLAACSNTDKLDH